MSQRCECCGRWLREDATAETEDGVVLCEDCWAELTAKED